MTKLTPEEYLRQVWERCNEAGMIVGMSCRRGDQDDCIFDDWKQACADLEILRKMVEAFLTYLEETDGEWHPLNNLHKKLDALIPQEIETCASP